ncbi:hypothetical protein D3C81_1384860 [compost metagenome]
MGGIGAQQARLARRRIGAEIAADIAPGQPERAQAADHHLGEVLAHAAAQREGLQRGCVDLGNLGVILEIGVDAVHQVDGAGHHAHPGREAAPGVVAQVRVQRHIGRGEDELGLGVERLAGAVAQPLRGLLPRRAAGRVEPGPARRQRDRAGRGQLHGLVRHVEHEMQHVVAEGIGAHVLVRGRRIDVGAVRAHGLPRVGRRRDHGALLRVLHGPGVLVGGDVVHAQGGRRLGRRGGRGLGGGHWIHAHGRSVSGATPAWLK